MKASIPQPSDPAELVANRFEDLSPQLRKAARFMLANPDDVALRSMRQLASQAGLSAATFVRLGRALGYRDYQELKLVFQLRMRERRMTADTGYLPRARQLQVRSRGNGAERLIGDLFSADIHNVEKTYHENDSASFIRATRLLETAKRVFVVGQRSCYSIAFLFNYVYRLAHANSILLQNDGGVFADELRDLRRGDVLISISVAPYSKNVVEAACFALEKGAKVLAITDSKFSQLGRVAHEILFVSGTTPSFFHSMISLVCVAETLLALLVARGGKQAMEAIELSEKQITRFNPYWTERPRKRSVSRPRMSLQRNGEIEMPVVAGGAGCISSTVKDESISTPRAVRPCPVSDTDIRR